MDEKAVTGSLEVNDRTRNILALTKYGDLAASTRQRLLQYQPVLSASGYNVALCPLLDNEYIVRFNSRKPYSKFELMRAYWHRLQAVLTAKEFDGVWVHYEAFPYLPGFMERLVFAGNKPVIIDFDDATFHQYDNHRRKLIRLLLGNKLKASMARSAICVAGNEYLATYAKACGGNVEIIPTVVDTSIYKPKLRESNRAITVGWIGSPSTWHYLEPHIPMLQSLSQKHNIKVKVVGAGDLPAQPDGIDFVTWSEKNEVSEIQNMDIGIMPLPNELWAHGKCGYKLIQYQSCGLPVVASPVGVNTKIVQDGQNGFLSSDPSQMSLAIETLISNPDLRKTMGENGRKSVLDHYSLQVHAPRLIEAFNKAYSI